MIHKFKASNFYSFNKEVAIDFRVDENAPDKESYVIAPSGSRISLVQAVIGPNASGKTTALRALSFINWLIVDSFRNDDRDIPVMPFAGHGDTSKPTKFEVEFEIEGKVHIYSVSVSKDKLLKEELYIKSLTRSRITRKRLFSRYWSEKSKQYSIDDSAFGLKEKYWSTKELKNTSVISAAKRFGHTHSSKIVDYWSRLETNVPIQDEYLPNDLRVYRALMYYQNHKELKAIVEEDVRRYADLGIESFGEGGAINHRFGSETFEIDFNSESSGTKRFLSRRRMMDRALEKGGIVVMDEFDAYLHPQMLVSLVDKFLSKSTNKGRGQLLLSAHELLLLNILDKYQLNLVDKGNTGATRIRRLDSEKGVRSDENILAKYIQGTYGAWPIYENNVR